MADTKLADLTALTTPSGDDILYIVDDPAGTPLDRKIALNNLFTRGTITADAPVLDASQTWNNGAVTFTGLKFNVVSDTSASGSLLMDLQVGTSSRFNVGKTGSLKLGVSPTGTNQAGTNVTIAGSQGTGTGTGGSIIFQVAPAGSSGSAQNALATALTITSAQRVQAASWVDSVNGYTVNSGSADVIIGAAGSYGVTLRSTTFLAWTNADATATQDVFLRRDATNTLALRNGANAQEFRVYENTTGTIYKAILGNRQLIKIAGAAFNDGAGASAGTITNAPAAGNPTKWIPIDDNGTTRHIPAW